MEANINQMSGSYTEDIPKYPTRVKVHPETFYEICFTSSGVWYHTGKDINGVLVTLSCGLPVFADDNVAIGNIIFE